MSVVSVTEVFDKVLKEFPDATEEEKAKIISELMDGHDMLVEVDPKPVYKGEEKKR